MKKTNKKRLSFCLSLILVASLFYTASLVATAKTAKAADYGLSNPRTNSDGVTTWDCVYFGNYWQDLILIESRTGKNDEKEPIMWRVLSVKGDDAFLLAQRNLSCQPYNKGGGDSVSWKDCTLRRWLNRNFYNDAFSSDEKKAIRTTTVVNEDNPFYGTKGGKNTKDKVYLLSIREVSNPDYGFHSIYDRRTETRVAYYTDYVEFNYFEDYDVDWHFNGFLTSGAWWLRSPGCNSDYSSIVYEEGNVEEREGQDDEDIAVRPVLHLDLSSGKWSKAGTVSSSGAEIRKNAKTKKPAKVGTLTIKKKDKRRFLSWKKVEDAIGYQIQYADNKKFKKKKNKLTKKTEYSIEQCKKNKSYYFRIRAIKLNGVKKVYGKWGKVKKVRVKK